jgi:hypothetical protein
LITKNWLNLAQIKGKEKSIQIYTKKKTKIINPNFFFEKWRDFARIVLEKAYAPFLRSSLEARTQQPCAGGDYI